MLRKLFRITLAITAAVVAANAMFAETLVILQTNDTHSQIDPTDKGLGGVQRRLEIIDSIRASNPNTILIDAGDAVQGTLFFTIYGGEVEMTMMNELGYDYAILGNHDFDNGMDALANNLAGSKAKWLTTNYDLDATPLKPYFQPYDIVEVDGRRIGFIALNLDPEGMIAEGNYTGLKYLDAIKAANATAWHLKHNEKVDFIVAITHLGYDDVPSPTDRDVASHSEDINVILGGHSHTVIRPGNGDEWVDNLLGNPVLITQNGKSGTYIAEITVNLDSLSTALPRYQQIAVDARQLKHRNERIDSILTPYRAGVDELMAKKIGSSSQELSNKEPELLNFLSDFCLARAEQLTGMPVDIALMNKGGIRRSLPKGNITQGQIIMMQPFDNRIVVEDIKGSDLAEAFNVMATRGGDGISRGWKATFDPATNKCTSITYNGAPLDPDKTYRLATIDYLANGGDYMKPLTYGSVVAKSDRVVYEDLIDFIKKNKQIKADKGCRMSAITR